ncbi:hypothetical protein HAX54_008836, partial [Datura stramonium]|nr:hypothetical protein [Datura stramonium]
MAEVRCLMEERAKRKMRGGVVVVGWQSGSAWCLSKKTGSKGREWVSAAERWWPDLMEAAGDGGTEEVWRGDDYSGFSIIFGRRRGEKRERKREAAAAIKGGNEKILGFWG